MNSGNNEHRPLEKWTTANLLGLLSFLALIIMGWSTLSDRVTKVETNDANQTVSINEIKRDVRAANSKIDQLLLAQGIRPGLQPDPSEEPAN